MDSPLPSEEPISTTTRRPTREELFSLLRAAQESSSSSVESIASLASEAGLLPSSTSTSPTAVSQIAPPMSSSVPPPPSDPSILAPTATPTLSTIESVANAGTNANAGAVAAGGAGSVTPNVGGIVGGSVGGGLLLFLLVVAGIIIRRRRSRAGAGLLPSSGGTGGSGKKGRVGAIRRLLSGWRRHEDNAETLGFEYDARTANGGGAFHSHTMRSTNPGQVPYPSRMTEKEASMEGKEDDAEVDREMVDVPLLPETVQSLKRPGEVVYPNLTSTHLYSDDTPPMSPGGMGGGSQREQKERGAAYFDYGTVSTVKTGGDEFDPYRGYGNSTDAPIQPPPRSLTPSSPTKTTRSLPDPTQPHAPPARRTDIFFDAGSMKTLPPVPTPTPSSFTDSSVVVRPFATSNSGTTRTNGTVDIYECISNPFMASFERSSPPQGGASLFSQAYDKDSSASDPSKLDTSAGGALVISTAAAAATGTGAGVGSLVGGQGRTSPTDSDGGDSASLYSQSSAPGGPSRANSRAQGGSYGHGHGRNESLRKKVVLAGATSRAATSGGNMGSVAEDPASASGMPAKVVGGLGRMDTVMIGQMIKQRAAVNGVPVRERGEGSGFSSLGTVDDGGSVRMDTMELVEEMGREVVRGRGAVRRGGGAGDYAVAVKGSAASETTAVFPSPPITTSPTEMTMMASPSPPGSPSKSVEDLSILKRQRTRSVSGKGRLVPTAGALKRARSLSRDVNASPRTPKSPEKVPAVVQKKNPLRKLPPPPMDLPPVQPVQPPSPTTPSSDERKHGQEGSSESSTSGRNPLTGAFGLGVPEAARTPATPTFQYAFADLEKAKDFLKGNAELRVLTEAGGIANAGRGGRSTAATSTLTTTDGKL